MPSPHPHFATYFRLLSAPRTGLFGPWKGDVFRSTLPRWISRPYRFTGVGAVLAGGRWNVKNLVPAVCFSVDADTVAAEADAKANRYGWTAASMRPQTRMVLRVQFQAVLDLTDPATLAALDLQTAALTRCNWESEQNAGREALTQAVARAVFEHRAEGLVVPSARHRGGINLVYFSTHRRDGSHLEAYDEASIPFMHGI